MYTCARCARKLFATICLPRDATRLWASRALGRWLYILYLHAPRTRVLSVRWLVLCVHRTPPIRRMSTDDCIALTHTVVIVPGAHASEQFHSCRQETAGWVDRSVRSRWCCWCCVAVCLLTCALPVRCRCTRYWVFGCWVHSGTLEWSDVRDSGVPVVNAVVLSLLFYGYGYVLNCLSVCLSFCLVHSRIIVRSLPLSSENSAQSTSVHLCFAFLINKFHCLLFPPPFAAFNKKKKITELTHLHLS